MSYCCCLEQILPPQRIAGQNIENIKALKSYHSSENLWVQDLEEKKGNPWEVSLMFAVTFPLEVIANSESSGWKTE